MIHSTVDLIPVYRRNMSKRNKWNKEATNPEHWFLDQWYKGGGETDLD